MSLIAAGVMIPLEAFRRRAFKLLSSVVARGVSSLDRLFVIVEDWGLAVDERVVALAWPVDGPVLEVEALGVEVLFCWV
jgi:hypothetical protein